MAIKEILQIGNKVLRNVSEEVNLEKDDFESYISDLCDTLLHTQKEKRMGRAIAAPQIGILKHIIYMEHAGQKIIMINPKIIEKSQETFTVWDSCFSANVAFFTKTMRHKQIKVKYLNECGNEITQIFSDDLSELFQHEIDHLDGILFTDRTISNQIIMRSEWEKLDKTPAIS